MIVERPGVERRVESVLAAGRIPVLLGGCAIGRTSILLRLRQSLGADRAQYLDFGAASTPERYFENVATVSRVRPSGNYTPMVPGTPRAAFDAMMAFFDRASSPAGGPATFLIDEMLDVSGFERFPGLRHVQRDFVARIGSSPAGFVTASRFTARTHRLLRDAPARFEVIHVPTLTVSETEALGQRFELDLPRAKLSQWAPLITALVAGRAGYADILFEGLARLVTSGTSGASADPVSALASLLAPSGRLTARCRESYQFRLHRARGYGALKAILNILAADEPQNLTEISHRLGRTPGSTKDYLSWLEDVDLVNMQGKRYSYDDALLRLYVRLYAKPVPPTEADILREVRAYAMARMPAAAPIAVGASPQAAERTLESDRASGIIEID